MSVQWSVERSLKLVELYHQNRSLWDSTDQNFRNRDVKNEAWDEVADKLNENRPEVERKMKNLLCHFHREYAKVIRSKPGSAAESDVQAYDSKWFAFKALQFVKNKKKALKLADTEADESVEEDGLFDSEVTVENSENDTTDGDVEDISIAYKCRTSNDNAELNGKVECDVCEGAINHQTTSKHESPLKKRPRKDVDGLAPNVQDMITDLHRSLSVPKKPRDEYDGFGEQVAFKIRKLRTHYAKEIVEHMINALLFEASIGKYDQPVRAGNSSNVPLLLQHSWCVPNAKSPKTD